jgi:hemolysin III
MSTQAEERLSLEEVANCATHGVGLALSLAGFVALVALAWAYGNAWHLTSCVVYGASLVALYLASTLYHGARAPRAKQLFQALDHCGIYLLIAGTYTPFALGPLRGLLGWTVLAVVWALALAGIVYKIRLLGRFPRLSTGTYLLMGWLAVFTFPTLFRLLPVSTLLWLAVGGLSYTLGTVFFHSRRIPYAHSIWHGFVLAGSACHFVAILSQLLAHARS